MSARLKVVVVGAGAFGGWTALTLHREGADVTLLDAWGPGHTRASSGGDTRIIRATYGPRRIYTRMAAKALRLWQAEDLRHPHGCLQVTGALWMSGRDDRFGRESAAALRDEALRVDVLSPDEALARWPQIDFSGISSVLYEPDAGVLSARRACAAIVDRFVGEGGTYRTAEILRPRSARSVECVDGTTYAADAVVWACGPWLGRLFPDVIGPLIAPTRQVVHYFATPPGDSTFGSPHLPVWLELGERVMYGFPSDGVRGVKIADDTPGRLIDPTSDPREISPDDIAPVRSCLARRFPGLADAPWTAGEVCQYEATPDSDFIIDTHPDHTRAWIVGGGSGHGFKMGPAIGELVAEAVLGRVAPDPAFSLRRFVATTAPQPKWDGR